MAGVALVFFVVLFFSLSSNSSQNYLVCAPSFLLCALKMSKSSTPKNHRLKIFPPIMLMNYQKVTKNRGRRFFTTYEKPIIYNQSSSLVCAPFLHRLYLFIGCERERERAGQRSPRDRARARGSNRYRSPFYYR